MMDMNMDQSTWCKFPHPDDLRMVMDDRGVQWYAAKDLAHMMGTNTGDLVRRSQKNQQRRYLVATSQGRMSLVFLSETAVTEMILRTKGPRMREARELMRVALDRPVDSRMSVFFDSMNTTVIPADSPEAAS